MVTLRRLLLVLLPVLAALPGMSQTDSRAGRTASTQVFAPRNRTIEVLGGVTIPVSHEGLTDFWTRGPGLNACLLVGASEKFKVGVGAEASVFSFRKGAFSTRYPGVAASVKNLTLLHVYLALRNYLRPSLRMSPYIGLEVGFARMTSAEQKAIINGVTTIYYEMGGIAHLTFGGSAGMDYYLSRRIAVQLDIRGVYMNNDPSVGVMLGVRGGLKYGF